MAVPAFAAGSTPAGNANPVRRPDGGSGHRGRDRHGDDRAGQGKTELRFHPPARAFTQGNSGPGAISSVFIELDPFQQK